MQLLKLCRAKKSIESLDMLVANVDMIKEMMKSTQAKDESEGQGSATGEQTPEASKDGIIRNSLDYENELKRMKSMIGLEV